MQERVSIEIHSRHQDGQGNVDASHLRHLCSADATRSGTIGYLKSEQYDFPSEAKNDEGGCIFAAEYFDVQHILQKLVGLRHRENSVPQIHRRRRQQQDKEKWRIQVPERME